MACLLLDEREWLPAGDLGLGPLLLGLPACVERWPLFRGQAP